MNTSRSLIKLFEHLLKKQNVKKKTKQKVGKEKKKTYWKLLHGCHTNTRVTKIINSNNNYNRQIT